LPTEPWLSGPVEGVPPLLQPVAHGILDAAEQIRSAIEGLSGAELTSRPAGVASIAFHVRHAAGSLDRLFTYARGEELSEKQRGELAQEKAADDSAVRAAALIDLFEDSVARALAQLRSTDESALLEKRTVGRMKLPSTTLGLLFHGAEHSSRHAGQVVTTSKLVRSSV